MGTDLSLSKNILLVFYSNPAKTFTINDLMKISGLVRRNLKRKTLGISLKRLSQLGMIERIRLADNRSYAYRLLNPYLANAYIHNDKNKPWLNLPLKPTSLGFATENRHRIKYRIQLTKDELQTVSKIAEFRKNPRTGGIYLLKQKSYTLNVNAKSGKGEIFLFAGWEKETLSDLGNRAYSFVQGERTARNGLRHISLPVELLNKRIRVGGSDVLIAGSHYPIEFDIQGKENDESAIEIMNMLTDQMKFNETILAIKNGIQHMDKAISDLANNQIAIADGISKIASVLTGNQPNENKGYKPNGLSQSDYSYR